MQGLMKVFITLLFAFFISMAFAQMPDVTKINARELKIKKVSFFLTDQIQEHHLFDTLGNLTESKFHLSIYTKRLRKYNTSGQLTEEVEYDDNDSVMDRRTIHYNKKKLPAVVVLINDEDSIIYTDSTWYTSEGREKEYLRYNRKGKVKFGFLFSYDKKGKLVAKKEVNRKKQLEFRTVFKYNKFDHLVEETTYDAAGKMDVKWETIYDQKGNEAKAICTGNCISGGGWINKYNDENRLIEYIELNENGTVSGVFRYGYDENGNKAEITLSDARGEIIDRQQLKYNHQNLLIEKVKNGGDVYRVEYAYY